MKHLISSLESMNAKDAMYSTEASASSSAEGHSTLEASSSMGWMVASGIGFILILAWMTNKLYRLKPPVDMMDGQEDIV
jgi:hypothetical protein